MLPNHMNTIRIVHMVISIIEVQTRSAAPSNDHNVAYTKARNGTLLAVRVPARTSQTACPASCGTDSDTRAILQVSNEKTMA